jgi:hypothetical protein
MMESAGLEHGSGSGGNVFATEVSQSLPILLEQVEKLVANAEKVRSEPYAGFRDKLSRQLLCLRPSVRGISAVSCCRDTPQLGFSDISGRKLETILEKQLKPPERETPEKQLQSWLIHGALQSSGKLKALGEALGNGEYWFVSDEIALRTASNQKLVADMLTVRVHQRKACLVNIELKSGRQMETFRQVVSFRAVLEHPSLQPVWKRFAEVMIGAEFQWDPSPLTNGLVIWPARKDGSKKAFADEKRKVYERVEVLGYREEPYSLQRE